LILILLCLATSAKIVAAQSDKAMIANSKAVGPVLSPPLASGKSQTIVCVLELSTRVRTFSIHFVRAVFAGTALHLDGLYSLLKLTLCYIRFAAERVYTTLEICAQCSSRLTFYIHVR
jgi:hypothetical protein